MENESDVRPTADFRRAQWFNAFSFLAPDSPLDHCDYCRVLDAEAARKGTNIHDGVEKLKISSLTLDPRRDRCFW
jgi:hypothetical protein